MPRRLGSSIPATVSRLLQAGYIQQPPAWFDAVGSVAPLRPSLTRKIPKQSKEEGSSRASTSKQKQDDAQYAWQGPRRLSSVKAKKSMKYSPPKPAPIQGLELHDKVRRMFFADHPFEAFRGLSLVEQGTVRESAIGPKGQQWTELRQRSINPSPDDTVAFILNLHQVHEIPLALAYQTGISQFQSLRASFEVSLHAAQVELEAHGFTWLTEFSSLDRLTRAEDQNILKVLKDKDRPGASTVVAGAASGSGSSFSSLLASASSTDSPQWTQGKAYFGNKTPLTSRKHALEVPEGVVETPAPAPVAEQTADKPKSAPRKKTASTHGKAAEGGSSSIQNPTQKVVVQS